MGGRVRRGGPRPTGITPNPPAADDGGGGAGRNVTEVNDSDSSADSGKRSGAKELTSAIGSGDGDSSDKGSSSSTPKELEAAVGSGDEE
jgi:hypothetical protein